jgi:hypothetical protein
MDEEIKQLIKQNQETLQTLEKRVKKVQKNMMWQTIGGYLRIILVVGPIVLGIIYLAPFVQKYMPAMRSSLELFENIPNNLLGGGNQELPIVIDQGNTGDITESFCDPQTRQVMINQLCN